MTLQNSLLDFLNEYVVNDHSRHNHHTEESGNEPAERTTPANGYPEDISEQKSHVSAGDKSLEDFFNKYVANKSTAAVQSNVTSTKENIHVASKSTAAVQNNVTSTRENIHVASKSTAPVQSNVTSTRENIQDDLPDGNELLSFYNPNALDKLSHNSSLPIFRNRCKILSVIDANQVTIVRGHTGCGKTTQVPQYILDWHKFRTLPCNIIVTQPRRIAAITMAKRVCDERKISFPSLVGYHVGLKNETTDDTKITFCTTGVLLQKLVTIKGFGSYTHVILDEVHERDQDMDFTMLLVKKLLRSSGKVKVIIMSATFDIEKFSHYFGVSFPALNTVLAAPVIDLESNVATRTHQITTNYLCDLDYLGCPLPDINETSVHIDKDSYQLACSLIKDFDRLETQKGENQSRGAVLIFLPGLNEIELLHSVLKPLEQSLKWKVFPLHSSVTIEEQQWVFRNVPTGYRKIIVATNIAESSITVPDIVYVVDFCRVKHLMTNPKTNYTSLQLCWASKSNCLQRAGRAGRVSEGFVYRLVPKEFYDAFPYDCDPEILRCPLANVVLYAKILDMGSPRSILSLALDPPDISNLESTILTLKEVGALYVEANGIVSKTDGDITFIGRVMSQLPLDIHISKLIILGHFFSVLDDCIVIAAALSVKSMFSAPFKRKISSYLAKLNWADGSCCDLLASLYAYRYWEKAVRSGYFERSVGGEKRWSYRHFLQTQVLKDIKHLVSEIKTRLEGCGIVDNYDPSTSVAWADWEKPLALKLVIAGSFYPFYFTHKKDGKAWQDILRETGGYDPFTTVYLRNWPQDQPGKLYSKYIKDYFQSCSKDAQVFFDSGRVYVQFPYRFDDNSSLELRKEMQSKVPPYLYHALKMKMVEEKIKVPLLSSSEAQKRSKELNLCDNPLGNFVLSNTDVTSMIDKISMKPTLPSIEDSELKIKVCYVSNPKKFWAQYYGDNTCDFLNVQLEKGHSMLTPLKSESPKERELYIVHNKMTKSFSRVIVEKLLDSDWQASVFFIDYGMVETISASKLLTFSNKEFAKKICSIPAQAFECTLCELEPSFSKSPFGCWTPQVTEQFKGMVDNKMCLASIYSVVFGVVSMNLTVLNNETEDKSEININQWLIENNYAEKTEESYFSKYDHETRLKHQYMTEHEKTMYMKKQILQQSWQIDPEPPSIEECYSSVTLKGPISPLEIILCGLTQGTEGKKVIIEGSSVNSVLLDTNPQSPYERLVVSTDIRESAVNNVILHDTSAMPNIGGFTPLVSLLFTPTAELRVNTSRTSYIGALCGLGYKPRNGEPLFPEHDMYVPFDVEFSNSDISQINSIRKCINLLTSSNKYERQSLEMKKCYRSIQDSVRKLMSTTRNPISDIYDRSLFWEGLNLSKVTDCDEREVFRLHHMVNLRKIREVT